MIWKAWIAGIIEVRFVILINKRNSTHIKDRIEL